MNRQIYMNELSVRIARMCTFYILFRLLNMILSFPYGSIISLLASAGIWWIVKSCTDFLGFCLAAHASYDIRHSEMIPACGLSVILTFYILIMIYCNTEWQMIALRTAVFLLAELVSLCTAVARYEHTITKAERKE